MTFSETDRLILAEEDLTQEAKQRQQAWDIFVASLRDFASYHGWTMTMAVTQRAHAFGNAPRGRNNDSATMCDQIHDFSEGYGWPDTLRALAQAMSADEQAKNEAMDRR